MSSNNLPDYGGINNNVDSIDIEDGTQQQQQQHDEETLYHDALHDEETPRWGVAGSGRREKRIKSHSTGFDTKFSRSISEDGVPLAIQLGGHQNIDNTTQGWIRKSANEIHEENCRRGSSSKISWRSAGDLESIAESIFSDIRSVGTDTRLSISNDAEEYRACTAWQRAFPERSFALIVTLIFELPTLFLISGGSDRLCTLIGRKKYTTLVALLPLISAISGNVGLQASTLTTRAISHSQVRTDNYSLWLLKEVIAALYLGIAIGFVIASMALYITHSFPFALSIFIAQFIGILTAGGTGTLAPLLFTFIFQRDSGKWGGPLETAVQDVVGSFAMIVVTYKIMLLFHIEVEPSDMC